MEKEKLQCPSFAVVKLKLKSWFKNFKLKTYIWKRLMGSG